MATRVNIGKVVQQGLKGSLLKVGFQYDPKVYRKTANRVVTSADRASEAVLKTLNYKLVMRTPRDTGRAQSGWNASLGTIDISERERKTKAGTYPRARTIINENNRVFRGKKASQQGFMANGVPYIRFLEDGRSDQQPQGWIKMTIMEVFDTYPRYYAGLFANGYTRDFGGGTTTL